jgi:diguanylate cyclase (GGDEF)-like protein
LLAELGTRLQPGKDAWKKFLYFGIALSLTFFVPLAASFHSILFIIFSLSATLMIFTGIYFYRPSPALAWILIGFGQLFNLIGDSTFKLSMYLSSMELLNIISTVAYILGMLCFFGGLFWLFFKLRESILRIHIIYGLVSTIGIIAFLWVTLINPNIITFRNSINWIEFIVFPTGLLIIGVLASIFLLTPNGDTWSSKFLFIGLIFNAIALHFYFMQTSTLQPNPQDWPVILNDATYSLAYLFIGISFLHPSIKTITRNQKELVKQVNRTDLTILGIAFGLPPLGLFIVYKNNINIDYFVVICAMMIIFSLVEFRLAMIVRMLENQNTHLFSQQAKFEYQAMHDLLTGLPNRLYLSRYLADLRKRREINRFPVAVFLIDLNKFKNVNDQFGHDKGDRVLKIISEQLSSFSRRRDFLGRWGGDEFLFILEDIKEADALTVAHRLYQEVRTQVKINKSKVEVDISIGICMILDNQLDISTIINQSDIALYKAKSSLNEKVAVYVPENQLIV